MRRGEGTGLYAPAAPNAYLTALPAGGDAGRLRAGAEGGARRDGQRAVRRPVALAGPGHGGVKEAPRQLGAGLPLAQRLPAALLPPDGPLPRAASTLSSPAASATGCTWAAWLGTSSWWTGPTGTGSAASSRRRGGSCHTLSSGTRNGCSWPRGATRSCTTCTPNSTGPRRTSGTLTAWIYIGSPREERLWQLALIMQSLYLPGLLSRPRSPRAVTTCTRLVAHDSHYVPGTDNPAAAPAIRDPLFQQPFNMRGPLPLPGGVAMPVMVRPWPYSQPEAQRAASRSSPSP